MSTLHLDNGRLIGEHALELDERGRLPQRLPLTPYAHAKDLKVTYKRGRLRRRSAAPWPGGPTMNMRRHPAAFGPIIARWPNHARMSTTWGTSPFDYERVRRRLYARDLRLLGRADYSSAQRDEALVCSFCANPPLARPAATNRTVALVRLLGYKLPRRDAAGERHDAPSARFFQYDYPLHADTGLPLPPAELLFDAPNLLLTCCPLHLRWLPVWMVSGAAGRISQPLWQALNAAGVASEPLLHPERVMNDKQIQALESAPSLNVSQYLGMMADTINAIQVVSGNGVLQAPHIASMSATWNALNQISAYTWKWTPGGWQPAQPPQQKGQPDANDPTSNPDDSSTEPPGGPTPGAE